MKTKLTLTQKQREILVGCILGDLHLQTMTNGDTFRCVFEQGDSGKHSHKEYLFHLYDCFKGLCSSEPRLKWKKEGNKSWVFETRALSTFQFYGKLFYRWDPEKGKKVKSLPMRPNLLKKLITPISVAYWFMDDGSLKSRESKGVIFNTHNFTFKEVQLLCDILNQKFGLLVKPRLQRHLWKGEMREYNQIYVSGHSFEKLEELVFQQLHWSMLYKWPLPRKVNTPTRNQLEK